MEQVICPCCKRPLDKPAWLLLDPVNNVAVVNGGKPVSLSAGDIEMLQALLSVYPLRLLHDEVCDVWYPGEKYVDRIGVIHVRLSKLRHKLAGTDVGIEVNRGHGYVLSRGFPEHLSTLAARARNAAR